MHDQNVNRKLDKGIEKFFTLLAPYFLVNCAHKALEWLIHRFHVHQFNKDAFLLLILPYHETNIFVRALQIVDLSSPNDKWGWLEPLQKPGVPLSSLTLVNRLATDDGFLKLLCDHVVSATSIYAEEASRLSTLYGFYTMAIVGAIERAPKITENQVSNLLSALSKGLASSTLDFVAASCMILAKLSCKADLNTNTMEHLLVKSLKSPRLSHEIIVLIFFLYELPGHDLKVSGKLVDRLSEFPKLAEQINTIKSTTQIIISKFLIPLLESAIKVVLKNPSEAEKIRKMVEEIFQKVFLDDFEVDSILENTLKPNLATEQLCEASKNFLQELYYSLEVKYPIRFDEYLRNLTKNSETDNESKEKLQFLMSWHSGASDVKSSLQTWDRLNHYSPAQRIAALESLSKNEIPISDSYRDMINKSLLERFNDDDVKVVKTLLGFPLKRLRSLFSADIVVDRLMILLSKCHTKEKCVLAMPALKLLLQLCQDGDDTSVFIACLPYLFPSGQEEVEVAIQVLESDFAKKNKYLQMVKNDLRNSLNPETIGSAAFHNILNPKLLPPAANILTTMKMADNGDATSLFFNLILLGSVCRVPVDELDPKIAREAIEMAAKMMKQYPRVRGLDKCNQITIEKIQEALAFTSKGELPLQAGTYVLEMVFRRLKGLSDVILDFENEPEHAQLILRLLEIMFDGMYSKHRIDHYSWCLKIFIQRHFKSSQNLLKFLSQFFVKPVQAQTSLHCLKIVLSVLNQCDSLQWIFEDKMFIMNLLITLSRNNSACREAALDILKRLSQIFNISMRGCSFFINKLYSMSTEISMDPEQLPLSLYNMLSPDPDVSSQFKKDQREKLKYAREFLFGCIVDETLPIHATAQLLEVLVHVNGAEIVQHLTSKATQLLAYLVDKKDSKFARMALRNILQRFNSTTVEAFKQENVLKFFKSAVTDHKLEMATENGIQTPSVILLKQIDEIFFEKCAKVSPNLQKEVFVKLVDIVTDCDNSSIVTAANRAVRRIKIHAQVVVDELKTMEKARAPEEHAKIYNTTRLKRRSRIEQEMSHRPEVIHTREWKRGITILEFIQRAENIEHEELLIAVLFELLRMCLVFEEQSPLEYTNQLLLSTIYHLATKKMPIPDAHLQVNLISQCIRLSHNPQTHHHALLVLVELFKITDSDTALHNIMPIFTFMGSSVLRQDDAYSIQIITKTIETIVPIVNSTDDETHAAAILRIFVVSLPDIPEHRRIPLFVKLLQLLQNHLHLFYLLAFESHVLTSSKTQDQKMSSQRLEFALSICQKFSPKILIEVFVKLVAFLKSLPIEVEEGPAKKQIAFSKKYIFDVAHNSPKQLRHYKYTIVQFLSAVLSSSEFVNRIALLTAEETTEIRPFYDRLIIELILLIQSTSKSTDLHQGTSKGKYWKVLLHNIYDILDAVNGLLPNAVFIVTVKKLINHDLLTVRRKVLELLNSRLQQRKFTEEDREDLLKLIDPLLKIVSKHGKMLSLELEIIQQTSLITLKLLAKNLATEYPTKFKPVLDLTTEFMKNKDGPLLGSVVLCVAELCGTMRTHAIPYLNKFVPSIIGLLKSHCHQENPDIVVISIVSALQKIVESVGNFLTLYLNQLLCELCRLSTLYTDTEHPKIGLVVSRLKATTQKLSSCIAMRVLLPAISKTYNYMFETKCHRHIAPLMAILSEAFAHVTPTDLQNTLPDLGSFFLKVLQFREEIGDDQDNMVVDSDQLEVTNDIFVVEEAAGMALVSLVLKLSEATFRPFYYKLYDWAARNPEHKHRNITFYRLSSNIAGCLKSLFVLFAGHFLKHAAMLLTQNNLCISKEKGEHTLEDEENRVELVDAILGTLNKVFSYDAHNFVNQERFETLAQPIVDQIENVMGDVEEFEKRAKNIIVPCVANFASAIQDDSLHKQLVYQTLLKTRHAEPYVRRTALSALVEIVRKLGEDFMPLLPETIPFLAEMLEDDDEDTEKAAQNAVRTLEDILGEPLQKYF